MNRLKKLYDEYSLVIKIALVIAMMVILSLPV